MNTHRFAPAVAALAATFVVGSAAAQEKGELWETTSQAEVPGLATPLPPIKGQFCARKGWTKPPETSDPSQDCKVSDTNRTGSKLTWTVSCAKPPMSGRGEVTFAGSNSYAGAAEFQTGSNNIRVQLTGRKVGSCDNPQ
jgi:Protein of unknown function (DUF3617)